MSTVALKYPSGDGQAWDARGRRTLNVVIDIARGSRNEKKKPKSRLATEHPILQAGRLLIDARDVPKTDR
jgi:hypothetical protein